MDEQSVTRSIPGSVGLLGTLVVVGLVVLGSWSFVDGVVLESAGEYATSTLGVLAVTAVVVGLLIVLGARSKRWREGPYW
ncbi:hypothetical protein [Natronorubrum aibiense]|uniref:Uncharacterized protein n=1 Tax=Natronorubrum aibiense TaxID=348826 RepID=A0A5P9P5V7_9EURY|nr:hypothetical protein [Natronorubrum aibiense]QFU83523.1 hypothetical protein GCU68_13710 [Natronorubrum aibiense]